MTNQTWLPSEEHALASYLAEQVCLRASGRLEDECQHNYPRDVYFVGNLRPMPSAESEFTNPAASGWLGELLNKIAPVAFGAEFLLVTSGREPEADVKLKWACYYRIFPTYSQQKAHQRSMGAEQSVKTGSQSPSSVVVSSDGEDATEATSQTTAPSDADLTPQDRQVSRQPRESLFIRFRKINCTANGKVKIIKGKDNDTWTLDQQDLTESVAKEMQRAKSVAASDPDRLRTPGAMDAQIRVPPSAMKSEQSYSDFLKTLTTDVVPEWSWEIRCTIKVSSQTIQTDPFEIRFEFANATQMTEKSPNVEPFFFDPVASFSFSEGRVVPYELEQAPRGFRYNRDLWGRGFNCAVEINSNDQQPAFSTTSTPTFRQMRYSTSYQPIASFDSLANDPMPVLDQVLTSMKEYVQQWESWREDYSKLDKGWEAKFGSEFEGDLQRYVSEINRYEAGLAVLQQNADARQAFQLTNEVFSRGPNDRWRIFQVVFLVSQIPGIVALSKPTPQGLADRDYVDIIYFPTGGGKTEAYLGVTVFHCFFDRLRGKGAGVTAWARFPLRLLTVQQMQRFADVIGTAELVRREQSDPRLIGASVDGFAVGYFVGQEATPNELSEPRQGDIPDALWSKALDLKARQDWKKIMRCPSCRTASVVVDFDPDSVRLVHRCTNPQCHFQQGVIPVYVVDNEIYRYLPSVIVGTIDKLAVLGNQRKFSLVLGEVDGRCRVHGYFKGRCCQRNCTDKKLLNWTAPAGISGPSLFVQDELHLLREGLGTFDAHYETFTQRLLKEFGQKVPLKIIASSATIEAFERQVEHLYGRGKSAGRVFPAPGPTLRASFYAETLDYPQRLYVGLIPHNKTIFNTILEMLFYYQQAIQSLQRLSPGQQNPYSGTLVPGTRAWKSLLDLYATSVTYFLAGRDLNSIRTDLDTAVNSDLQSTGYRPADIFELTGSTSTDQVTKILDRLQTLVASADVSDTVLATSMISHGVDIDRLNAMFFYGMPRQNAEYIQSSSRVGRSHVGIVFTCLHPARERDQSHYSYFVKFHEFLGQLIEPVAINRWSKFSVQRTLPGLFMAVLLQLIANRSGNDNPNRYYMVDFVKREISSGNIRADQFIPLLQESYAGGLPVTSVTDLFSDEITLLVRQFIDQIVAAGAYQQFVSETLIPRPMTSLREVDELLDIELDEAGTRWGARSK